MTTKEPSSNTSKVIIVIASILVVTALGFFAFNYFTQREINRQHELEEAQLSSDIVDLERQILEFKIDNDSRQTALRAKESELSKAKTEIDRLRKKLSLTQNESDQLKMGKDLLEKKLSNLELMIEKYQIQVRDLIAENIALKKDKSTLQDAVEASDREKNSLKERLDQKDEFIDSTIQIVGKLRMDDLTFFRLDNKGNPNKKPDNSFRRFNLHGIQVCFDVLDNELARSGQRDIYLILENPSGSINTNIKEGYSGTFNPGGKSKLYTSQLTFNYNNERTALCIDYVPSEEIKFEKGLHLVRIITDDGNQIGMGKFEVK